MGNSTSILLNFMFLDVYQIYFNAVFPSQQLLNQHHLKNAVQFWFVFFFFFETNKFLIMHLLFYAGLFYFLIYSNDNLMPCSSFQHGLSKYEESPYKYEDRPCVPFHCLEVH